MKKKGHTVKTWGPRDKKLAGMCAKSRGGWVECTINLAVPKEITWSCFPSGEVLNGLIQVN